ncbi:lactosylceramide 4-alpha-galactosyltransferase-like [Chironomus tepperi]|uniref:lactosylceramide 4-alpha-galactosyltransferase-like n=1 Tax=Chironomus tepperi TaxID=113505 RepID=UPI00391F5C8B
MKYQSAINKLRKPDGMIWLYLLSGACCVVFCIYATIKITNGFSEEKLLKENQELLMKIRQNQLSGDKTLKPENIEVKTLKPENFQTFFEPKTFKLENILSDSEFLEDEKTKKIFLLETHMDEVRILENARQACSVESAAITNPEAHVYFILATNSSQVLLKYSELAKVLMSYNNIHIRYLNIYEFSKGTILESLIAQNTILKSRFPIEHMADVMRVMVLSRYGGTYLDLDVLSLVPIAVINQENFACPENDNVITNAVVNIGHKNHEVMQAYLHKLNSSYNPNEWAANGPNMLTNAIRLFCEGTTLEKHRMTKCGDFTTFSSEKCYPIEYGDYWMFYNSKSYKNVTKILNETQPYFLHIWNKMLNFTQQEFKLTYSEPSSYVELGKKYCPQVIRTTEKYFR